MKGFFGIGCMLVSAAFLPLQSPGEEGSWQRPHHPHVARRQDVLMCFSGVGVQFRTAVFP